MIDDITKVFRSAKNKRFLESQAAWINYLRGLDEKSIDSLVALLHNIDVQRISLAQLSGLLQMASLERLPSFERLGFDKGDPRLYDTAWEQY